MSDPIVDEVRKHRKEIAARFGHDLKRIAEYFKKREGEGGRKIISHVRKPTAE